VTGAVRIGTRASQLAMWQAARVATALRGVHAGLQVEIVPIESHGDRKAAQSVADLGRTGIFTREIEVALQKGAVDVAVHSLKDLPTESPDGLMLAALLPRDDPRDALVARALVGLTLAEGDGAAALAALPRGARLATSSLRRRAELLRARPDLEVVELRGNVPTRVAKVESGEVDGIVISNAGLVRLGIEPRGLALLDTTTMLPAPAQGTIAVQVRADDDRTRARVEAIDDAPTRLCTTTERVLLHELEGGCRVPLGALATLQGDRLTLRARLQTADGRTVLEDTEVGPAAQATQIARRMALDFQARGAARILATLRDPSRD
jgi:hydroxymethylbilane synthase